MPGVLVYAVVNPIYEDIDHCQSVGPIPFHIADETLAVFRSYEGAMDYIESDVNRSINGELRIEAFILRD